MNQISLLPSVENSLKHFASQNERKYHAFHPSSFGGCLRATAYQYFGIKSEKEFDPRMQRIWDAGTSMHERYQQRYFRKCADFIQYGYWICTHCEHIHGKNELRGIPEPEKG